MVDMSPEAVTKRLRLMDELWELGVKLMSSTVRLSAGQRSETRNEDLANEKSGDAGQHLEG